MPAVLPFLRLVDFLQVTCSARAAMHARHAEFHVHIASVGDDQVGLAPQLLAFLPPTLMLCQGPSPKCMPGKPSREEAVPLSQPANRPGADHEKESTSLSQWTVHMTGNLSDRTGSMFVGDKDDHHTSPSLTSQSLLDFGPLSSFGTLQKWPFSKLTREAETCLQVSHFLR